jgi:LysR family transcriptional regulator, hydrogen peroxide-inducible genes activator
MITLRQLRYLVALAEHRHFGRAADACAITQPALSMQIRDLEKHLGIALVERRPNDVMLTELGVEVARHAELVLLAAHDLEDLAKRRGRVLAGYLRLGIIPTLAPYVLPKLLPDLQRLFRELHIELRETQTRVLLDELNRGILDVALLALPVTESGLETIPLFDDAFLLAVPASDPRPERVRVTTEDIDPVQLILLEEGHCLRDQALALCAHAHGNPEICLGATSLATVMQMVANGYGITLVPKVAVDVEVRDERVKLLRFMAPEPGRKVGLAWRRTSPRKVDFLALGQLINESLGFAAWSADVPTVLQKKA